jgi:hypothetical protein
MHRPERAFGVTNLLQEAAHAQEAALMAFLQAVDWPVLRKIGWAANVVF